MVALEQLELFRQCPARPGRIASKQHGDPARRAGNAPWLRLHSLHAATGLVALQSRGRDFELEANTRGILTVLGAKRLARNIRVEWNPRLQTCAGRADFRARLVSLNPKLRAYDGVEIDRTLRHELAHLLAQFRVGRRRILPHGPEWHAACHDLGIGDEVRCHNLPFPTGKRARRFLYKCPNCQRDFPRVRRIKRTLACLACCRAHNRGKFDARFRLQIVPAR